MSVLILLGPPGAGKGTQANRLAEERSLPHVSTGDLFRENLAQETDIGRRAKTYMNAGKLVPDEIVLEMLFERVARPDCAQGYVLDGFPRTMPQAEALQARLPESEDVRAISLEVPDEVVTRRLCGRLTCSQCGHMYHVDFQPPRAAGVCDECGGELVRRPDDEPEVIRERLSVYSAETAPLIDFYAGLGLLHRVDGDQKPSDVFDAIVAAATATASEAKASKSESA